MMFKRLILLLVIILSFSIIGCGKDNVTGLEDIPEEPQNNAIDLDGYEFIFGVCYDFQNPIGIQPYFPLEGTSQQGDAMLSRYKEIENMYNCSIVEKQINEYSYQQEILQAAAIAEKYSDILVSFVESTYKAYRADLLQSYSGSDYIDLSSSKWGTPLALELMTFDGENCYGVQPDLWPISERGAGIYGPVLFNPDVIKEYQQPNPYELQESGIWNWDNFEKIAVACTEDSTNVEDIHYGITSQHDDFGIMAIYSNNGRFVKEQDGRYVYGYTDPAAVDALVWMQDLMFNKKVIGTSTTDWWGGMKIFSNGRSAFHVGRSFFGLTIPTGTEEDNKFPSAMLKNGYGWIPFPYGPNSNADDWSSIIDCVERFFVIPINTDSDIVMRIMDDMFEPIVNVPDWKQYYRRSLFFEEQGFTNFNNMLDNAQNSYFHILDGWDGRQFIVNAIGDLMKNAKKSPIQTVTEQESRYQQYIDERVNNIITN